MRYFVTIAWLVPSKRQASLTDINEPELGNNSKVTLSYSFIPTGCLQAIAQVQPV